MLYNTKYGSDKLWIDHIFYRARKQALAAAKDAQKKNAIYGITQVWLLSKSSLKIAARAEDTFT